MATLHAFADLSQLEQTDSLAFGPRTKDLFRITSSFISKATSPNVKVYAPVRSNVLVQKSSNNTVNLILKPLELHTISYTQVKYFIIRGVRIEDFLDSDESKVRSKNGGSAFILKMHNDHEVRQASFGTSGDLLSKAFGWDNQDIRTTIDSYFFGTNTEFQSPIAVGGMELGEFYNPNPGTSEFGIDIILEEGNYQPDMEYARKLDYSIDVSNINDDLEKKVKREEVLNFIDPAAYYGMHNSSDVGRPNDTDDVYNDIVQYFATANTLYIDVRNDLGLSYNFFENYIGSTIDANYGKSIQVGEADDATSAYFYKNDEWPIFIQKPAGSSKDVNETYLALRINDNQKPIIYIEHGHVITSSVKNRFITDDELINTPHDEWTKAFGFSHPNTRDSADNKKIIAWVLKLHYGRQKITTTWPNKVVRTEKETDNLFGPINAKVPWSSDSSMKWISNQDVLFREIIGSKQIMERGIAFEGSKIEGRVTFYAYAKEKVDTSGEENLLGITGGLSEKESFFQSVFTQSVRLNYNVILDGATPVNVFNFSTLSDVSIPSSNLLVLGLSASEFNNLQELSGLSNIYPNNIYLEKQGDFIDDESNKKFQKYILGINGLKSDGTYSKVLSSIVVYSIDGLTYYTDAYSKDEPIPTTYIRDYEEAFGAKLSDTPDVKWEDYFIGLDTHGSLPSAPDPLKKIVDDFIVAIEATPNDSNAKSTITTHIRNYAPKILARARSYVKNVKPDDRPLYWARIKMAVALKSHLLLLQSSESRNELVKLFEQYSRGYTGIDFSSTPAGAKKILITGFDPFGLNYNVKQSNPSGALALSLGGEIITSGAKKGIIQSLIVPVRYEDFDQGIVEDYVAPFIGEGNGKADLIITISQSGMGNMNIDRFATINRGGGADNLGVRKEENSTSVNLTQEEFEKFSFLETTLPKSMVQKANDPADASPDEWTHSTVYAQHFKTRSEIGDIEEIPDYYLMWDELVGNLVPKYPIKALKENKTPTTLDASSHYLIEGSGGNYLSNEIFYRVALARERWQEHNNGKKFSTGHFHIPWVQTFQIDRVARKIVNVDLSDEYVVYEQYESGDKKGEIIFSPLSSIETPKRKIIDQQLFVIKTVGSRIKKAIENYDSEADLF